MTDPEDAVARPTDRSPGQGGLHRRAVGIGGVDEYYACCTFGLARVDCPSPFSAITSPHRTSHVSTTTSSASIELSARRSISTWWHCVARNSMP